MGFFDFFRRPPPIRDAAALADFIDQNSAFVARILRRYGADRRLQLDALIALSVFDRYPVPAPLGAAAWSAARAELARRLALIGLHPPKRAMDVPEPWAETYFNLMPIHEKLRRADQPAIRNYLRVTMINIHEFSKRMDAPALASALSTEVAR